MESDRAKIKHLLSSDRNKITSVEFSDSFGGKNKVKVKQTDTKFMNQRRINEFVNGNPLDEDLIQSANKTATQAQKSQEQKNKESSELKQIHQKQKSPAEVAAYQELQEGENRQAIGNEIQKQINEEKERQQQTKPINVSSSGTTFKQTQSDDENIVGGGHNDLAYLDDFSSPQYGGNQLSNYERDFYDVYQRAREYRDRVLDGRNEMLNGRNEMLNGGNEMLGGKKKGNENVSDNGKPKRPLNPVMVIILELAKIMNQMKDNGQFPSHLKQKHFMKIGGMIVCEAKQELKINDLNDEADKEKVRQKAKEILQKRGKNFIDRINEEKKECEVNGKTQSKSVGTPQKKSNKRNQRGGDKEISAEEKYTGAIKPPSDGMKFDWQTDAYTLTTDKNQTVKKNQKKNFF